MFTGIIEELGEVVAIEPGSDSSRITVRGTVTTVDPAHGASIAVNGACLTVTDREAKGGVVTDRDFTQWAAWLESTGIVDRADLDPSSLYTNEYNDLAKGEQK